MGYEFDWVIAEMKSPSRWWHFCTSILFGAIGIVSKIIIFQFNTTKVYNKEVLIKVLDDRPPGTPVITVANHYSCIDDPALWSLLPFRHICSATTSRWALAAHDICFTNQRHSTFFLYGKCIPVVRGDGVYQPAVNLCMEKLKKGEWVHVFPEGKVNLNKGVMRLKWGVGRMIHESPKLPIIIPIWHIGMDEILPNEPPYYVKFGKKVTYNLGNPIDLSDTIALIKRSNADDVEARRLITEKIQEELFVLRKQTELLHSKHK